MEDADVDRRIISKCVLEK